MVQNAGFACIPIAITMLFGRERVGKEMPRDTFEPCMERSNLICIWYEGGYSNRNLEYCAIILTPVL